MSFDLVSPSSIVPVAHVGKVEVGQSSNMDRFAIIDSLNLSQLSCIFLHQISQSEHAPGSISGVHSSPRSLLKSSPSRIDSRIDVLVGSSLDGSQNGLVVGVDHVEGLAFDGVDESAVDEELLGNV